AEDARGNPLGAAAADRDASSSFRSTRTGHRVSSMVRDRLAGAKPINSALSMYGPASGTLKRKPPSSAVEVASTSSEGARSDRANDSTTPGNVARPAATVPTTVQPTGDCACPTIP